MRSGCCQAENYENLTQNFQKNVNLFHGSVRGGFVKGQNAGNFILCIGFLRENGQKIPIYLGFKKK